MQGRLNPYTVLRRICQLCGIRLVARDFGATVAKAEGAGLALQRPFVPEDFVSLEPVLKTCEPEYPYPKLERHLSIARYRLQEGDLQASFEVANEAAGIMQNVMGSSSIASKGAIEAYEAIANVFLASGDIKNATSFSARNLQSLVQLHGLDAADVAQQHLHLSQMLIECGDLSTSVQHLLSAKYIIELIGGRNHPNLCFIFQRLAGIYSTIPGERYKREQEFCLNEALSRATQVEMEAALRQDVAAIKSNKGDVEGALTDQRDVHRLSSQLYGEQDSRTLEAKANYERYQRASIELRINELKELKLSTAAKQQEAIAREVEKRRAEVERKRRAEENGRKSSHRGQGSGRKKK